MGEGRRIRAAEVQRLKARLIIRQSTVCLKAYPDTNRELLLLGEKCRARECMQATVFLGGGRITSALVAGLRLAGYAGEIVVYDRNPGKVRALRREARVEVAADLKSAVRRGGMVIVAVRPGSVAGMLEEIAACGVRAPRICVSLAAGVPLPKLRGRLGARWVRAMPSPVCRVGRGLTALSFERDVTKGERRRVRELFERVGAVLEIPEKQFDAFTAVYSSSHGYHALATLAKAAEDFGLDRATALTAAAHALGDGIRYWRESGKELIELLHEAATPGGIAAATMSASDGSGYARAVKKGIRAGIRQARLNARG
jgi:pyrroline-5-carboxylate reductase